MISRDESREVAVGEEACITCGDIAVPLEVIELDEARGLAVCRDERDRRETVETALVLPIAVGDHVLAHAGTAIAHLGRGSPPRMPGREAEDMRDVSRPGREAEDMRDIHRGSA